MNRFEIWRQDEHGNKFFVAALNEEIRATDEVSRLNNASHKQHYWVVDLEKLNT